MRVTTLVDQRDDEEALQGRGRWICGSVGQLCGDRRNVGPTRGTVCTLVGRGLPPLPRDCQGRLSGDWIGETTGVGPNVTKGYH